MTKCSFPGCTEEWGTDCYDCGRTYCLHHLADIGFNRCERCFTKRLKLMGGMRVLVDHNNRFTRLMRPLGRGELEYIAGELTALGPEHWDTVASWMDALLEGMLVCQKGLRAALEERPRKPISSLAAYIDDSISTIAALKEKVGYKAPSYEDLPENST